VSRRTVDDNCLTDKIVLLQWLIFAAMALLIVDFL
jgi:hypothetical protein